MFYFKTLHKTLRFAVYTVSNASKNNAL